MNSITVVYLKKRIMLDISTENKKQDASKKITKLILKRVKPLYMIILVNIYNLTPSEHLFEEVCEYVTGCVYRYTFGSVSDYLSENNTIDTTSNYAKKQHCNPIVLFHFSNLLYNILIC